MHKYSTHKCTMYAHVYNYVNVCIHPRMEISHQRSTNLSNPLLVVLRGDSGLPKTKPPGTITAPRYQFVYFVYIICKYNTCDNMANALNVFQINPDKKEREEKRVGARRRGATRRRCRAPSGRSQLTYRLDRVVYHDILELCI